MGENIENFESLVQEALQGVPSLFKERIENIAFVIEDWPSKEILRSKKISSPYDLFALYQGVPLKKRLPTSYSGVLPDKIIIYQGPHEAAAKDKAALKSLVKTSVLHELGHYFGLSEKEIQRALGEE